MQAYVMRGPGQLELCEQPEPQLGPDEITLRTVSVSICSTDISYFRGHLFPDRWPIIPGHEYVGEVVEIGERLPGSVELGQRVCYWGQTDFGGLAELRTIR